MRQVKLFKSLESDISALEKEVNTWIRDSGVQIVRITGNIAPQSDKMGSTSAGLGGSQFMPSDVLMIILYEVPSR